ncbi:uncharacterized protein LOC131062937 [Cryptomeria japonica]|uniref:uncharacterized protein LOC131062937 n=1 Tax=Cryptomeria japonica TaxID=3369 RepID=UPI0025AC6EAF|nr:uncharacterized protein LOC131062937 [Cryptomeria japonica]XP_057852665.1 uncharacterized protein LOC131062937 [Cryptomeria japonica]
MTSKFCCRLFLLNPFHFCNAFSTLAITNAHSQSLFSQFASSKFNMSAADITRIFKIVPSLQRLQTLEKVEQFVHMLHKRGFSQVQIADIMRKRPHIICFSAERKLEPKIKLLEVFGFEGQALTKLLTRNHGILTLALENILPTMEFLQNVFQSQDLLVKALLGAPFILNCNLEKTLKPSVALFEGWGFRGTELSRFVLLNPRVLSLTSLTPAHADLIHKIGGDKQSKMFKFIVSKVVCSRIETLEAKIENLKLCGLSAEETWQVFRGNPALLSLSKEYICEKMKFLVNTMELPTNYVVTHPGLWKFSLEKTMRPRFLVWQKIKDMNDVGLSLLTVLRMTEARFVGKLIKEHPESETLLSIYQNAISSSPNCTKRSTKS